MVQAISRHLRKNDTRTSCTQKEYVPGSYRAAKIIGSFGYGLDVLASSQGSAILHMYVSVSVRMYHLHEI